VVVQSLSCMQPTHVSSVVSQIRALDTVQSVDCRHCTQYIALVLQIGLGAMQSVLDAQPETQRLLVGLQDWPEAHWVVSRHCTQLPSGAQCGVPPAHCKSVRQCTHCSMGLQ
jgi:hypothetical protein